MQKFLQFISRTCHECKLNFQHDSSKCKMKRMFLFDENLDVKATFKIQIKQGHVMFTMRLWAHNDFLGMVIDRDDIFLVLHWFSFDFRMFQRFWRKIDIEYGWTNGESLF